MISTYDNPLLTTWNQGLPCYHDIKKKKYHTSKQAIEIHLLRFIGRQKLWNLNFFLLQICTVTIYLNIDQQNTLINLCVILIVQNLLKTILKLFRSSKQCFKIIYHVALLNLKQVLNSIYKNCQLYFYRNHFSVNQFYTIQFSDYIYSFILSILFMYTYVV